MSSEDHHGRTPRSTYREILIDYALPNIYIVFALITGFVFIVNLAVVIHVFITPVYSGELAATIADHSAGMYVVNMFAWLGVTLWGFIEWLRWDSDD